MAYTLRNNMTPGQPEDFNDVTENFQGLAADVLGTYRSLLEATAIGGTGAAATYVINDGDSVTAVASTNVGASTPAGLYLASTDYAVSGLTTKLRARAQIITDVAPAITYTVGLYPTSVSGTSLSLGTVVSGSTVALASPAADSVTQGNSGDFTFPSDGFYTSGVVYSGTPADTTNLLVLLQLRHV